MSIALIFYIGITKQVPHSFHCIQIAYNQLIIIYILKMGWCQTKKPFQNGRVVYHKGVMVMLFCNDPIFGIKWLNQ